MYRAPTPTFVRRCDPPSVRAVGQPSSSEQRVPLSALFPPAAPAQTAANASADVALAIPASQSSPSRKAGCPYRSAAALSPQASCFPFSSRSHAKHAVMSSDRNALPLPRRNSRTTAVLANPQAQFHRTTKLFSPPRPHVVTHQLPLAGSWHGLPDSSRPTSRLFFQPCFVIGNLLNRVRAGFGALCVLRAGCAANTDCAYDLSVHHQRNPAFGRHHALKCENPQTFSSRRQRILKRFRRPLEERSATSFIYGYFRAAKLRIVHFLVVNECAPRTNDRHGHSPIIFGRLRQRRCSCLLGIFQADGRAIRIRHLRYRARQRAKCKHHRNNKSHHNFL